MPKKHVSYTQKSLKYIRGAGFLAEVVERWIMGANIRKDLFGLIDIVAIGGGRVLGIQSTGINGRKSHQATILDSENTVKWLESGAELWQISWDKKLIKKGGSAYRYSPVIDYYALSVTQTPASPPCVECLPQSDQYLQKPVLLVGPEDPQR